MSFGQNHGRLRVVGLPASRRVTRRQHHDAGSGSLHCSGICDIIQTHECDNFILWLSKNHLISMFEVVIFILLVFIKILGFLHEFFVSHLFPGKTDISRFVSTI